MKKNIWIIAVFTLLVILVTWFLMYDRIEEAVEEQGEEVVEDFDMPLPSH